MSRLNHDLQKDEIEALTAIYGEALQFDENARRLFITLVDEDSDEKRSLELEVQLTDDYPANGSPVISLSAPFMSRECKNRLLSQLKQILDENPGEPVIYQWIERTRTFLREDSTTMMNSEPQTQTLAAVKTDVSESSSTEAFSSVPICHGEPLVDRKSVFQAHVARVTDVKQAKKVISELKGDKKLSTATHNISAYRISGGPHGTCFQDCDDDGENQAGSRLLHLLQILDISDIVIVVSRWFGGIQLGPDRFKHINHVARDLISKCGLLRVTVSNDKKATGKDAGRRKKGK